ncbi:hypothetical protein WDW37_16545 [Bdellovibrionota bacterium FG-1]
MIFNKAVAWFALALVFLPAACTHKTESPEDPKGRLNSYISQSFAVKGPQDRKELATFLTGESKVRIESWSDEQFRQAFVESKRQFIKLAFKELKSVSAEEVNITYELTYQTNEAKITNRKLAQMVHQNGKWLISDVRNLKELVEYKNELSLP